MASTDKKPASTESPSSAPIKEPIAVRAVLGIYRFLASLKLAVISIAGLAAILGYATFYEKEHGPVAVQMYIYQSPAFSIVLAFLAINILCAATIRYPWKRRQTGFVVTHLGLLVLIFGSWWGFQYSDEGQVGGVEGSTLNQLVRKQAPVIRVREINPGTGHPMDPEYAIPFDGGAFDWPDGKYQLVTQKGDPFKIGVKHYYAAALPKRRFVEDPNGSPMIRIRPRIKPPGADSQFQDVPIGSDQWLVMPPEIRLNRVSERAGPARISFFYVDSEEKVEDFLKPPASSGELGAARLRYTDKTGKRRYVDVKLDGLKPGQAVDLPDSGLTVTFIGTKVMPIPDRSLLEALGEDDLHVVEFDVKKGSEAGVKHTAFASLPMIPSVIPSSGPESGPSPSKLIDVSYHLPPHMTSGGGMMGNFGVIEVLGDPSGKLYYRVFGRDPNAPRNGPATETPGVLRAGPAPLKLNEQVIAFGGNDKMPMTLDFAVEDYLVKGRGERIYESFTPGIGQKGTDFAAIEIEMTVDGVTRSFWVNRTPPPDLNVHFRPFTIGKRVFEVAYDFDRKDLGFSLFLKKFKVGFDPGTSQASSFESDVLLTDETKGIKEQPIKIWMNHPLTHREYTFYQSSYDKAKDPETDEPTGDFISVFQVGHDAGRTLKYLGSLLIVIGTFLQFYMRAGVFTDGGKHEESKAAERAKKLLEKKGRLVTAGVAPTATAERPEKPPKKKKRDLEKDNIL